jgi:hypothetical protein
MDFNKRVMRKLIIVAMLVTSSGVVKAQNFNEWFRQKQTQIKYLTEQIAALKAYGEVMNKGYAIAQNGLAGIFTSKVRDYKQHNSYFISLWKVRPALTCYSKVLSIYQMRAAMVKQQQLVKSSVTDLLAGKEKEYIHSVYSNLIGTCNSLITELYMTTSDDQAQLKDDERLDRIDKIYLEMQDHYSFSQSFTAELKLFVMNRLKQNDETSKLSRLYGIK